MTRSFKLRRLSGIDEVMARSVSYEEAGAALGVKRWTVWRWVRDGKVPKLGTPVRPRLQAVAPPAPESVPGPAPEPIQEPLGDAPVGECTGKAVSWLRAVLALRGYSETERVLLEMADHARRLANDPKESPLTQLNAMNRFQQLVKPLHLDEASAAVPSAAPVMKRQRAVGDPRAFLVAANS